jgi:hypothetical protein
MKQPVMRCRTAARMNDSKTRNRGSKNETGA